MKHFTVIGITNLLGEPICCILIIESKEELFGIRAGIYFSKNKVGDESDREELLFMGVVSDKYHPGGPTFTCEGGGGSISCQIS